MKLLILCRYNQARSIVIAAALRKLFPDYDIVSAGIEAPHGKSIPEMTAELCLQWNLPNFDRISIGMQTLDLDYFDAVLAADNLVRDRLHSEGFANKTKSLYEFEYAEDLLPVDPTGLSFDAFSAEIAKALVLAMRWIQVRHQYIQGEIVALWFNSEIEYATWLESEDSKKYQHIIDSNFAIPHHDIGRSNFRTATLMNLRERDFGINQATITDEAGLFLMSRFECDDSARIVFDSNWIELLQKLANSGPVALIGYAVAQRPDLRALSLLGLLHSTRSHS
jgi:protein-tyrosine-phosphatase